MCITITVGTLHEASLLFLMSPSHFAAFFFEAKGQRKKLQKRKAVSVRRRLTLRQLLKKLDQNFKKWAIRHILSFLIVPFCRMRQKVPQFLIHNS
jgi:hypothetical protein